MYIVVYTNHMVGINYTDEFKRWLKRLRDKEAKARILQRIDRVKYFGNPGDVEPVGGGIYEMKVNYGPGYRLYYANRGSEVILLLIGGDKSTQKKDIAKAKKLNERYE